MTKTERMVRLVIPTYFYRFLTCFLFLSVTALTATITMAGGLEEQTSPLALAVEVRGNEHISTEYILKNLTHIRLGEPLSPEAVKRETQVLMDLGYFSAVDVYKEPVGSGIKVIFQVHENPVFTGFNLVGLKTVAPEEFLPYLVKEERKGEIVNLSMIAQDVQEAIMIFQEKEGWFLTVNHSQIAVSQDGVVTLSLTEVKLGRIIIEGLEKTKEFVVTRELSLREGELLNMNVLREDLNTLGRLRIFEDIKPYFRPTPDPEVVDVVIELTEGSLIQFNFGFSYVPNTNLLTGYADIIDPNFRGLGQQISFKMEVNQDKLRHFAFSYREPWLDEAHTSFGLSLYSNDDYNEEEITDRGEKAKAYLGDKYSKGVEVSVGRPLTRNLRGSTSLQFEKVKTKFKSWVDEEYTGAPLANEEYWNNNLGLGLSYDRRLFEKIFYTTGGYFAQVSTNLHGGFLGGKYDYQSYTAEFRQFFSPMEHTTLCYRIKGGTLVGDIPETDLFALGGVASLRGYGDKYLQGEDLFLTNLELRQRIPGNDSLEFACFYDLGSVDYDDYFQGYGVGLRYITILGQLRFDFAWTDRGETSEPKFHFLVQEMF